ncbi:ribonuclease H-like domain-containing protein [Daldinia caldariorum]|uniref:ribonuclease H-like domain-containing protein n=1 Tax=Daldinia caldariorum TaxID=326644 RepID=UPI002007F730|nr:ribonuclease H-like domain-containing protein [Daldinia caldariorum]KAI1472708.1 ribonuclease H-like domain-containing protein [Daldinia caldariorum]
MPIGWYLAQGLYPLGPSSSDDEEGPCELPNGRIVCGPHGLVVCGKCTTDYSFMSEDDEDDEDEDDNGHVPSGSLEIRRGMGRVIPTKFVPPTASITPTELFPAQRTSSGYTRYIRRGDRKSILTFTDGACLNNGQPDPRAGWAVVLGPGHAGDPAIVSRRVETRGPFGDEGIQSSNRAELRAVIATLRIRNWVREGYTTIVIATDSEYVVEGSTTWARTWTGNSWRTRAGGNVKNQDLWEMLLGEFERWKEEGLSVKFWRISRDWNTTADAAAKQAASMKKAYDVFTDV